MQHDHGAFSWADLATTDAVDAQRFYGELFGWDMIEDDGGGQGAYTFCFLDDDPIAALYGMGTGEQAGAGPHWTPYVTVDDVAFSVKAAEALGGTVAVEPFTMGEHGRLAVVRDTVGGLLGLWEPLEIIGAQRMDEPNTLTWFELITPVGTPAARFYTDLLRWDAHHQAIDGRAYTLFTAGERFRGGMTAPERAWGDRAAAWLPYFEVDDCDAAARLGFHLGGNVPIPPRDIPGAGRAAMLTDPQGAPFSVISSPNP